MKERPILFSGPMVQAILDWRKTQTRRVIKATKGYEPKFAGVDFGCPFGQPGDRLWVREAFMPDDVSDKIWYRADFNESDARRAFTEVGDGWKSSIHMPRSFSRITLEITGVRVERVQEITEDDAKAEGVQPCGEHMTLCPDTCYGEEFAHVWNSINAKRGYGWDANPFVWAISFKRIEGVTHDRP